MTGMATSPSGMSGTGAGENNGAGLSSPLKIFCKKGSKARKGFGAFFFLPQSPSGEPLISAMDQDLETTKSLPS